VQYDAQFTPDQRLNLEKPLSVYWIMNAEKGQREELTWFERTQAYGFDVIASDPESWTVTVAIQAFKKRPIQIYTFKGVTDAEMEMAHKRAFIQSIYVKMTESFIPSVEYVDLKGIDRETGKPLSERMIP